MKILSSTNIVMVGENCMGYPTPPVFPGLNVQADFLVVLNAGASDCYVAVGQNAGVTATSSGTLVAAPTSAVQPRTLRVLSSLEAGPLVTVPLVAGDRFFSAVAIPTSVIVADTAGTASSGSTSLTVASAAGIVVGQGVQGPGIQTGTLVTNVTGTTIVISIATTAALSSTEVQFTDTASPAPPAVLIVALGAA